MANYIKLGFFKGRALIKLAASPSNLPSSPTLPPPPEFALFSSVPFLFASPSLLLSSAGFLLPCVVIHFAVGSLWSGVQVINLIINQNKRV